METLITQTSLDCVESFLCHQHHQLPVLGSSALDQVFYEQQQQQQIQGPKLDMERMSPDSSMDWNNKNVISASQEATNSAQPDSTTSDLAYDSDAFNSDDSNESLAELENNPNLLTQLHMQATREVDSLSSSNSSPPTPQQPQQQQQQQHVDVRNNNLKLAPTSPSSISSFEEPLKKRKKKKSKRAGDVVLKCELCSYTTRFKEHLTSHMNRHNNDRKYMCSDCGQTFKWSHSLKRHQRTHQADFKFSCRYCFKLFSRKDHLTIHENLHNTTNETYPCKECGATFKNKKTLTGHMKTHSAEKQFKCDQCESEFTRRASLKRHIRAAHAGQMIPCPFCPAHFSYRSTLEDHKKAAHNEGKRDFECDLCGVKFAVKAYLSKHLVACRNRANGQSFSCDQCPRSFPSKRHLNVHQKRKHMDYSKKMDTQQQQQQQQQPNFSHPPPAYNQEYQNQNMLPSFQYPQYPSGPSCELCHASFPNEHALETHLLGHLPPTSATPTSYVGHVTGNDLPLPQLQEGSEENVGSLLRLVYSCSDTSATSAVTSTNFQGQGQGMAMYQERNQAEQGFEYPILEGLGIDCL